MKPLLWNGSSDLKTNRSAPIILILEKIPFFVLTAISCVMTFIVQRQAGAVSSMETHGLTVRIANALVSYVGYMGKMIWPYPLSVFYPHPGDLPLWQTVGAALILLIMSFVFFRLSRRYPYLIVGWLWYLGTLVPVIGLVQVGGQAMADRYTYVPIIGLFIMIGWGMPNLYKRWHKRHMAPVLFTVPLLFLYTALAWSQVRHWKDSITLFDHTVKVTENNALAHYTLGLALLQEGKLTKAITHFSETLKIKPDYNRAHDDLGVAMARQGNFADAVYHFREALRIRPENNARAHHNLGMALRDLGKISESIIHFREALRIRPDYLKVYYSLGTALKRQGNLEEAIENFQKALQSRPYDSDKFSLMEAIDYSSEAPDYAKIHFSLAAILAEQDRLEEAIEHYSEALRSRPDFLDAQCNLGVAFAQQGNFKKAIAHFQDALRLRPDDLKLKNNLAKAHRDFGLSLRNDNKFKKAIAHFQKALEIKPDYSEILNELAISHNNYGAALGHKGNIKKAIAQFRAALKIRPNYADAEKNLKIILDGQKKFVEDPLP
jgi:tetratricopeptide (TPR) repeat protein